MLDEHIGDPETNVSYLLNVHREAYIQEVQHTEDDYPVCEENYTWGEGREDAYEPEFTWDAWDDVSGRALDPEGVKAARRTELEVIEEYGVWEVMPRPTGVKTISTRWVYVNKGDSKNKPELQERSRCT